jgi:AraC family transcriptional regulator
MRVKLAPGCYFGDRIQRREVAGFLLTEYSQPPGDQIPKHSHERSYFSLIVAGDYAETYENRSRACQPGTVVVHPAGEAHAEHVGGAGAREFNVEVAGHWLGDCPEYRSVLNVPADFRGGPFVRLVCRLYREFCRPDPFTPLAIEGLMLELVAGLARRRDHPAGRRPPLWLARVRELLRARFVAPPCLAEMASEVGVHAVHLARAFRAHCGCSVGEYVRQLRVEFACRQLATSDCPLAEIALAAGFADQSHFGRTFKRLRGVTPAEFRHQHRPR